MELSLPNLSRKNRTLKDDAIDLFYGTEEELEYPKTGEFQAIVDLLRTVDEEVCRRAEHEVEGFTCKICEKSFRPAEVWEKRLSKCHSFCTGSTMNDYSIRLEQDYAPIRLGKWSKVICEFRHRYCQDAEQSYKNAHPPEPGFKFIDDEQTRPKASPEEQNYAKVVKKLDECLQAKSSPYKDEEKDAPSVRLPGWNADDSGIHSPSPSPLGLSTNLVDLDADEEGLKKTYCSDTTKIYVDLKSRRFRCESCAQSFDALDDAEAHLTNYSASPSLERLCRIEEPHELLTPEYQNLPVSETGTEKCHDGSDAKEPQDQGTEPEDLSSNAPPENNGTNHNQDYATLDVKDVGNCNGTSLFKESDLEFFREDAETPFIGATGKSQKKKKKARKKKKNKPWRMMKRAFLLALGVLF